MGSLAAIFPSFLFLSPIAGIYASCTPDKAGAMATIAANQLARLTEQPVKQTELARARNQLASSVMMNLETRALLCEDIGRQILSHGKRMDPAELVRRIQAVSQEDILRVMRNALSKPPAFAVVGEGATASPGRNNLNQNALPSYEALQAFFDSATNKYR
jgi:mitochondrial-processing peptidase subunit alpha